MKKIEIYSDGGSRGNPGPAACAFVVFEGKSKLHEEKRYLGNATNNVAEYIGVLMALSWLGKQNKQYSVDFYLDSQLVQRQLSGEYKIKNKNLIKIFNKINIHLKNYQGKIKFIHVKRSKNKISDRLVNEALDENLQEFTSSKINS